MVRPVPEPPLAMGVGLPWDVAVVDAVGEIAKARSRHGDTFAIESGGSNYLFTFSTAGVTSFYALTEDIASKGLADYLMLRRKLPDELFDGRRTLPNALFRRDDVASYLRNLQDALTTTITELGDAGTCDLFDLARRLAHRMGLMSWACPGAGEGARFDTLVGVFDELDGADAFVHPDRMAAVAASDKRAERAALAEIVDIIGATPGSDGLFGRITAAWADEPAAVRRRGVGLDVALIHIASMSNLAAALGWMLVDLLAHPMQRAQVVDGDGELAVRCALESTRLAQRSIMSRTVVVPTTLDTGEVTYQVPAGWTIATLLPLLNTSSAPGLAQWDPDRWTGHRLGAHDDLASPVLVTAFGHGRHTCPAQSFSLSAMTIAARSLLSTFDLTPGWSHHPAPIAAQIGGVARAREACPLRYRRV